MVKKLLPAMKDGMSYQDCEYLKGWRFTWKCRCGCGGVRMLSRHGVSRAINRHLKRSPECTVEDCKRIEVK